MRTMRIAMAGWLHGVFVGDWLFVFPLCGFSLSLFCNYYADADGLRMTSRSSFYYSCVFGPGGRLLYQGHAEFSCHVFLATCFLATCFLPRSCHGHEVSVFGYKATTSPAMCMCAREI